MIRIAIVLLVITAPSFAQPSADEAVIRKLFDEALSRGQSYEMLEKLTKQVGPRLSGSPGAAAAVEWSRDIMNQFGFDSVWLQAVMVPHWVRGEKEIGRITNSRKMGAIPVNICALGGLRGNRAGRGF